MQSLRISGSVATKRLISRPSPNNSKRHQHAPFALDHLEIGKLQEIGDVLVGQPVAAHEAVAGRQLGVKQQQRVPQPCVVGHDQARLRLAEAVQVLERRQAVVERADRVRHDDGVEFVRQFGRVLQVLDVVTNECQVRIGALGARDLGPAEIDADAVRGTQRIEQMAVAAAEVENALAGRHQKAHIAPRFLVVIWVPLHPAVAFRGELLGLLEQQLLAARHWALNAQRRCRCGLRFKRLRAALHSIPAKRCQ